MEIWWKIRIQRAKITMGTIFGPFISILSQKNILGQNMKNCRFLYTLYNKYNWQSVVP